MFVPVVLITGCENRWGNFANLKEIENKQEAN